MTKEAKRTEKSAKAGAVELTEDRLDQVAGAAGSYAPIIIRKAVDKSTP